MIAETINDKNNITNIPNPVFLQALQILEESKLLSVDLAIGSTSRMPGGIQVYTSPNGVTSASVALETIVDAISRAILIGFQKGVSQATNKVDGAAMVGLSINPLTELPTMLATGVGTSTNLHEAIISIGKELSLINTALASLSHPIVPQIAIPSVPLILE
jgi:hypothetical protein